MNGEKLFLNSDGVEISALIFRPELKRDKYPSIIIAHGIPSTPSPVEEKGYDVLAKELLQIGNLNFITIIFNFRGCMGSGGLYSPLGWVQDLKNIHKYLLSLPEIDEDNVILLSFSAGAMVSFYFAAHIKIKALISCACPSNLSENSELPKRLTVGIKFAHNAGILRAEEPKKIFEELLLINPLNWVEKSIVQKLLILHGEKDDLINVENAHLLHERAKEPKELMILQGAGHKLRQNREAITIIKNWIQNLWMVG